MVLGIIAKTDRFPDRVAGLARAASGSGHHVSIFMTASGVRLCLDERIHVLSGLPEVDLGLCHHSARELGVADAIPDGIARGSQYNNASMIQRADRVVCF
ncbi:MAG: hypothetical protein HZA20_07605 [Nitrospirae bacterium]|jgi:hypothetical protein|nr:hypothetical protein [Nitrospirota bacterium]